MVRRRNSEEKAIFQVFTSVAPALGRYVARFLNRREDVEDVVQETFERAYKAEKSHEIRSPKSYLFRTARNLAFNQLSKKSHSITDYMEDLGLSDVLSDDIAADERLESQRRFEIFCEAVVNLPPQCRKVFVMRKVSGLSHKEISNRLGISASTVEKHLARGLQLCASYMSAHGYPLNESDADEQIPLGKKVGE